MAISHLSVDESLIANEIAGNKYRENPNGVFRTRVSGLEGRHPHDES
jgi:hypothetical protein